MKHLISLAAALLSPMLLIAQTTADPRVGQAAAAGVRPAGGFFVKSPVQKFREMTGTVQNMQLFAAAPEADFKPGPAKAKQQDGRIYVGDWVFNPVQLNMSPADRDALRALFKDGRIFSPGDETPCGKFFGSYLVRWTDGKDSWFAVIGLDCQEVRGLGPGIEFARYIPPAAYASLVKILSRCDRALGG